MTLISLHQVISIVTVFHLDSYLVAPYTVTQILCVLALNSMSETTMTTENEILSKYAHLKTLLFKLMLCNLIKAHQVSIRYTDDINLANFLTKKIESQSASY